MAVEIDHTLLFDQVINKSFGPAERVAKFPGVETLKKRVVLRMDSVSNNGGQKKCKCKKSKCLKLYCECFAAGFYCDETCACKECFNSPDYEDTVDEARKQIQLRNPNAFSSKIHSLVETPKSHDVEDKDQVKPIAGKHRRGCNCKKSMCEKKYCECYQAKVGCCDECRCQGCKNVFGKKTDYNAFIHEPVENETQSTSQSGFSLHVPDNSHNLTPMTPFQHVGHEYDPSTTGCYMPTLEPANSDMLLKTSYQHFDMVSLDQQPYLNGFMNQFTPPDTTHFNSMMNLPPLMDLSKSSSGSYYSVISSPGSLMTPVKTMFAEPQVMTSHKKLYPGGLVHNSISHSNN